MIWKLHGICYREMGIAAKLLAELAENGEINRTKFDLDTLEIHFDEHTGEIYLTDEKGNVTGVR